ncbi:hypothetical protein ACJZ2D_011589 [Fusarium nematophilum]
MPRKAGTGCITCRIRRVKCDEAKPSCQRCLSSKRQCDGYLPEDSTVTRRQLAEAARQLSVVGPISHAITQYPRHGGRSPSPPNLSLFDVFRNLTAPSTASFIPSQFWTRELLQLAHTEPAVWHATLALGALHQRHELYWQGHGYRSGESLLAQANQSYGRAITYAKDVKDPTRLLSLSLALVSITNMMGRWAEGQVHIRAGHQLLRQAGQDAATRSAADVLTRLDLQAMTFSDSTAPYPYQKAPRAVQIDTDMRQATMMGSYSQAGTALFGIMRRFILLDETMIATGDFGEDYDGMVRDLIQDLVSWEFKMAHFERGRPKDETGALSVRLYHTLLRTFITAIRYGSEMRWDGLLGHFERILNLSEALAGPDPPGVRNGAALPAPVCEAAGHRVPAQAEAAGGPVVQPRGGDGGAEDHGGGGPDVLRERPIVEGRAAGGWQWYSSHRGRPLGGVGGGKRAAHGEGELGGDTNGAGGEQGEGDAGDGGRGGEEGRSVADTGVGG